jgi:hypothetical protein
LAATASVRFELKPNCGPKRGHPVKRQPGRVVEKTELYIAAFKPALDRVVRVGVRELL